MSDITGTLWFLLFAASSTADVFYFNEEIDGFFSQFQEDIKDAKNFQFPLPNIHADYAKTVLFVTMHGEMNGTGGTVKDMSTIKRTSNVTIVTAKEYFVFKGEFGFDELTVFYNYKARFIGIPFKGDVNLSVKNNSIYLELLVNLTDNRCSGNVVTVRSLRIRTLDGTKAKVSGFSIINPLMGYWLSQYFDPVCTSIIEPIEDALRDFIKANINDFDFCKFGKVPQNLAFNDMDSYGDPLLNDISMMNSSLKDITATLE